jgi:integrase
MMRAGSGHIEFVGNTCYLRVRRPAVDRETGEVKVKQTRITLGSRRDLRSKSAARAAADRWLASQQPESLEPGVQATVIEYLAHYLAIHVPMMRPSSQRRYKSTIGHHLAKEFEGTLLERVDIRRIQVYAARLAPHFARETVRTILATLLQVMTQAREDGFAVHRIDRKAIKLPKASDIGREKRNIGDDELRRLIAESELPWRALWAVMGYAGLRCGEALGLTWGNIDLDAGVIRVRQAAVLGRIQLPKTATSRADLPVLPELEKVLREYRARWVSNAEGLLFISNRGTPLRADNVRVRVLRPTLKRLGLAHSGLHAFRHGLPARLNSIGVSPGVIQKCMRHASLAQTEAYLHVGTDDVHAAIDAARARGLRNAGSISS